MYVMYVCMYLSIYLCMYVCMYLCIYIYINKQHFVGDPAAGLNLQEPIDLIILMLKLQFVAMK